MEIRIIKKEWSKWLIESCYYPEPKGSWLKCQNKGPRISSVIEALSYKPLIILAKIPILCAWRLSLKSALTSMEFGSNWYQIRNKTCYIPKVRKCYVKKGYLCEPAWECHLWHVNVYIKEQSLMQRGHPMELYFEGLEMWKWIIPIERAQREE